MFATLLCFLVPSPIAPQMTDLRASFTRGEPRAYEVTSDGHLGFLAEGATITILNMNQFGGANEVIDRVNLEYPNPLSMVPHYPNGLTNPGTLFIAGGASGLWQMDLCTNLSTNQPCLSGYNVVQIDAAQQGQGRKVCIDVTIIPGTTSSPVPALVAVYAAIGDANLGGPSELRIFDIGASSTTHRATVNLPTHHPDFTALDAIAYAVTGLASTPRYAFAACGTAGIARVNVDQGVLSNPDGWPAFENDADTAPQRVRDVTMVVNPSTGLGYLFAALDYGTLVEIKGTRLTTLWNAGVGLELDVNANLCGSANGPAPAHRVAAAFDGTSQILIAVATDVGVVSTIDHAAPMMANGFWNVDIVYGLSDPGMPSGLAGCEEMIFFKKTALSSNPVPISGGEFQAPICLAGGWALSLSMVKTGASTYYTYETRLGGGLQRRLVQNPFGTINAPSPSYQFRDGLVCSLDGAVSKINPGVSFYVGEQMGGTGPRLGQLFLNRSVPSAWKFDVIPESSELCGTEGPGFICPPNNPGVCWDPAGEPAHVALYNGGFFGAESWIDPCDPHREWFFTGEGSIKEQSTNCTSWTNANMLDPCTYSGDVFWREPRGTNPGARGGWKLVSIKPCAPNGCNASPNADLWQVNWWQLPSEYGPGIQGKPQDYRGGWVDPRSDASGPVLLHGTRSATAFGYVLFRMAEIGDEFHNDCNLITSKGDWILGDGHEFQTHVEFDPGCSFPDPSPACDIPAIRPLATYNMSICQMTYQAQPKAVSAICVGQASNYAECQLSGGVPCDLNACPQWPICPVLHPEWYPHYKEAMVVFYDVSDPTFVNLPALQRVGLVPRSMQPNQMDGRTWSIATTSNGTSAYAFAIDLDARLYVFDISPGVLYGALPDPTKPRTHPANALTPIASPLGFDATPSDGYSTNPYDGRNDNGVDAVVHGEFLYVALGRGGVAIVDISNPSTPFMVDRLETPGLAEGVHVTTIDGVPTLFVGDSRAGLRVYQDTGP